MLRELHSTSPYILVSLWQQTIFQRFASRFLRVQEIIDTRGDVPENADLKR
jgi:hypothetical protein